MACNVALRHLTYIAAATGACTRQGNPTGSMGALGPIWCSTANPRVRVGTLRRAQAARGAHRMMLAPATHTATPSMSQRSGRTPSANHIHAMADKM